MIKVIICGFCEHNLGAERTPYGFKVKPRCKAFPQGVPHEFAAGVTRHLHPVPGDNGLVFSPKPSFAKAMPALAKEIAELQK